PSRDSTARSSSRASASRVAASTAGRERCASATTWVSTGTLDSRSDSAMVLRAIFAREIVAGDRIAAALVGAEAGTCRLALGVVCADDLQQSLEAREVRRALAREVEQHRDVRRC